MQNEFIDLFANLFKILNDLDTYNCILNPFLKE